NRMSVKDGRLALPDGLSYRVLVVPEDVDRLTLPVARKIRDLVSAGAIVVAPRPGLPPSLSGAPAADEEIRAIANDVWGSVDGRSVTEHAYGKGKVYWGLPVADVLGAEKVMPDFEHTRPQVDSQLVWIHRRTPEAEIYFVASQNPRADHFTASFRVE